MPSHAALDTRWCQDLHGLLLHRDRRTVALDPPGLALEGRSAHWARSRGRRCTFVGLVRQRVVGRVELLSYSCKLSKKSARSCRLWPRLRTLPPAAPCPAPRATRRSSHTGGVGSQFHDLQVETRRELETRAWARGTSRGNQLVDAEHAPEGRLVAPNPRPRSALKSGSWQAGI